MLTLTMVPRRSNNNMDAGSSSESPKLNRAETELRKCLGNDVDAGILLKSYACAWQKEILVQGHVYITSQHFCFYSNILSWETKMVINVRDVIEMRKDKTAHLFPNAIVITTSEKKYGFSTFAHRNKAFNVLHLVWQNALSEQPVSQDQLSIRIKLLKKKSKSVESSPATTPKHGRKLPSWQLSVSGLTRNGLTDSESSGTDSPILLSQTLTPSPSPHPSPTTTTVPPSLANDNVAVPFVTVTTENITSTATTKSHTHQLPATPSSRHAYTSSESTGHDGGPQSFQNSYDSAFTDAVDGQTELTVAEIDSDTSESALMNMAGGFSSTNTSDTESNLELEKPPRKPSLHGRKARSPSVIGLAADITNHLPQTQKQVFGDGGKLDTGGEGEGERGMGLGERGTSALKQILGAVHIHPTRIGLWRLKSGLQDWCTPSNFINLLIVISIFLLLVSTASMVCKLSYVSPTFQPLLAWQPWCKLCSECGIAKLPSSGMVTVEDDFGGSFGKWDEGRDSESSILWTPELFEELVKKHENDLYIDSLEIETGDSSRLDNLNSNEGSQSTHNPLPPPSN